jgi:hypothetical protein
VCREGYTENGTDKRNRETRNGGGMSAYEFYVKIRTLWIDATHIPVLERTESPAALALDAAITAALCKIEDVLNEAKEEEWCEP